ncbi:MAG: GlyGly-CTERM sorting domain-containing protein, partial [Anaerolineales bacterium]|nr:GlyGly-CTERM sorting domain-containing protein [Anaerolineales bacterium]
LMLGSLRKVWPWKNTANNTELALPAALDTEVAITITIGAVGFLAVLLLTWLAARRQQPAAAH